MSNVTVLEQLKLVLRPDAPSRRLICVEETDTSKGDIILSFYLWYVFNNTDCPVWMIGVRDTYGHYQNIGMKFHYNLLSMANRKRFSFVECDTLAASCLVDCAQKLLNEYETGPVYLIVDDVSALLLLGEKLENIVSFLMYVKQQERLFLVFGCRKHKADEPAKRLASAASHIADVRVALAPLITGFSNTATGTLRITSYESMYQVDDISYLYKLVDNGFTLNLNSETFR